MPAPIAQHTYNVADVTKAIETYRQQGFSIDHARDLARNTRMSLTLLIAESKSDPNGWPCAIVAEPKVAAQFAAGLVHGWPADGSAIWPFPRLVRTVCDTAGLVPDRRDPIPMSILKAQVIVITDVPTTPQEPTAATVLAEVIRHRGGLPVFLVADGAGLDAIDTAFGPIASPFLRGRNLTIEESGPGFRTTLSARD